MDSTKTVAKRPARVLLAVDCKDLEGKLQAKLCRFPSLWTVESAEPVGSYSNRSIVAALAAAVNLKSDYVLYASAIHKAEAVASHFFDQRRDLCFLSLSADSGRWAPVSGGYGTRGDSVNNDEVTMLLLDIIS